MHPSAAWLPFRPWFLITDPKCPGAHQLELPTPAARWRFGRMRRSAEAGWPSSNRPGIFLPPSLPRRESRIRQMKQIACCAEAPSNEWPALIAGASALAPPNYLNWLMEQHAPSLSLTQANCLEIKPCASDTSKSSQLGGYSWVEQHVRVPLMWPFGSAVHRSNNGTGGRIAPQ